MDPYYNFATTGQVSATLERYRGWLLRRRFLQVQLSCPPLHNMVWPSLSPFWPLILKRTNYH